MSGSDDLATEVFLAEPEIARITPQLVEGALQGFELSPDKDFAWIARGIQASMHLVRTHPTSGAERQSNIDTKKELRRFANRARKLWSDLTEISDEADDALWDCAWEKAPGIHDTTDEAGETRTVIGAPKDYAAYKSARSQIEFAADQLEHAARHIASQKQSTKWRAKERRVQRIQFAICLSQVFEGAFSRDATVNRWERASGPLSLGPWADFFTRMMKVSFNEDETPDVEGVLVEARKLHLRAPVKFTPGMFPE